MCVTNLKRRAMLVLIHLVIAWEKFRRINAPRDTAHSYSIPTNSYSSSPALEFPPRLVRLKRSFLDPSLIIGFIHPIYAMSVSPVLHFRRPYNSFCSSLISCSRSRRCPQAYTHFGFSRTSWNAGRLSWGRRHGGFPPTVSTSAWMGTLSGLVRRFRSC